ncbi:MAG: prolipoprotein diacylglyceryl transferase [Chlorobi bacterium]|nr:MAG: prolipoprotein diacylglyceryl transferase [Chlorobi bacterium OLB7]MBK8912387.1 prolipoprotein diacylglyceryl transferase [Chlorobiota bacterium]
MYPELFSIGPITVHSFGLMMGIAFIVANYFFAKEIVRRGLPEEVAGNVTLLALVAGIVGAKLFSVFENFGAFLADPFGELFSAAGLTFYGGLLLAIVSIWVYLRRKKIPFIRVADAAAPTLILAYGIGRIGCQLAGDGDYGIPTNIPWAMTYPNGTVSTLSAKNAQLAELYQTIFPGQPVPVDIPVHPAPVYETLAASAIFAFLWGIRKRPMAVGQMFAIYLILAGIERLLVEFIRLNDLYAGLSQAQWISVGMIAVGSIMIYRNRTAPKEEYTQKPAAKPAAAKRAHAR